VEERFAGVERLYGEGTLARLARARVAVVGVGGVGGWAAEALARSGIGALTLIDGDEVCLSNTNRQIQALEGAFGEPKVAVLGARLRAIHPGLDLGLVQAFLLPGNVATLLAPQPDAVLDACDQVKAKAALAAHCRTAGIPLVTCGAAGGKTDPTRIEIADLGASAEDPLLAELRRRLRREHGFPRGRPFGVRAVFSREPVRRLHCDVGGRLDCRGALGSVMHLTASIGLAAAGEILRLLLAGGGRGEAAEGGAAA
jgi:tRNA A37 threonylcarbamoyladenosine dehydratase